MNPARTKISTYSPQRVTVAVLVHIPHLIGYHRDRLSVAQLCFQSLVANTTLPHDLMVFDNGSCAEAASYLDGLQTEGTVQLLIRSSTNLGKIGAFQIIFRCAPGELVAYSDEDFYFYPGWMESQLQVLDAFPKVGMVGGYVVPGMFEASRMDAALKLAEGEPEITVQSGKFIPEAWIADWALSTGRDPEQAVREAASQEEYVIERDGVHAFAAANHDQFIAPKAAVQQCLPTGWSGQLMGEMIDLDQALNRAGYLRLATRERTTRHLGNVLSEQRLGEVIARTGAGRLPGSPSRKRSMWVRLLRSRPVRFVLLGVYSKLFRLINPD